MLKRHFPNSRELRAYVAEQTGDTCLLSFSAGKDSVVAWVALREQFQRVIPYYLYCIPDLEFIEEALCYYENHFKTKIIRLPIPSLYRMLNNMLFQPPERCLAIEKARLPRIHYNDSHRHVRAVSGTPNAYVAIGARTADSPIRYMNIKRFGPINVKGRTFQCVYDWKMDEVCNVLDRENLKLPVDYEMFGRSFDGIDYRFLEPLKRRFPRDYQRILDWFPLAELELKRREFSPHNTPKGT